MRLPAYYNCISNLSYNELSFNKGDKIVITLCENVEPNYKLDFYFKGGKYHKALCGFIIHKEIFHYYFKIDKKDIRNNKIISLNENA